MNAIVRSSKNLKQTVSPLNGPRIGYSEIDLRWPSGCASGTVVNVTSVMGHLTLGCHGFYSATKSRNAGQNFAIR